MTGERFSGCLLGLALGDALGAPYEGGPLERLVWRVMGRTRGRRRWTDDTQMALDLAEGLVDAGRVDPDDLARRFAASCRWSRGYGPGTRRVLKRVARGEDWRTARFAGYPQGSFGNGAAMRAPVVGLFYADRPDERLAATRASAEVTHAHPLAVEGALVVATATALALSGEGSRAVLAAAREVAAAPALRSRLALAEGWLGGAVRPAPSEVARQLGNGIAAVDSCVTAVYGALAFLDRPFDQLLTFVRRLRGDVDTIGAMAGAIWGAAHGAERLPAALLDELEDRERVERVALALHARAHVHSTRPDEPSV